VIGMRQAVPDQAAIAFATGFYQGVGTGQGIEEAFQAGCKAIQNGCLAAYGNRRKATIVTYLDQKAIASPIDQIPILKQKSENHKLINE
jgi:hypothetical protein